jgi:hypothetical protein
MTEQQPESGSEAVVGRRAGWILLLGLLAALATLAWFMWPDDPRPLYPALPTRTRLPATVEATLSEVSFPDLAEDPIAYRDQRIQVTGNFTPVTPPDCRPYSGPPIAWSLVSDELQLNAVGFEDVLRLVAPGTTMTVTGTWRAYQGPLGCGKEPKDGTVWYLQVDRILEPNPLVGTASPALTFEAGEIQVAPPDAFATQTLPPTLPVEATPALPPSPTEDFGVTPEPTIEFIEPTPTLPTTPLVTTPLFTPTPDSGSTPDLTLTPESGTPGSTPGTATPTVGAPTATLQGTGYPGGTPTPTATQRSGYP